MSSSLLVVSVCQVSCRLNMHATVTEATATSMTTTQFLSPHLQGFAGLLAPIKDDGNKVQQQQQQRKQQRQQLQQQQHSAFCLGLASKFYLEMFPFCKDDRAYFLFSIILLPCLSSVLYYRTLGNSLNRVLLQKPFTLHGPV